MAGWTVSEHTQKGMRRKTAKPMQNIIVKSLIVLTAPIFAHLLVIEGTDLAFTALVDIFVEDVHPFDVLHPGVTIVLLFLGIVAYHLVDGLILLWLRRMAIQRQVLSSTESGLPAPYVDLGWSFLFGTAALCSLLAMVLWLPTALFLGVGGDSAQRFFSFLMDVELWATGVLAALVCHIRSSQPNLDALQSESNGPDHA